MKHLLPTLLLGMAAFAAQAQTLSGLQLSPDGIAAGQSVQATVNLEVEDGVVNCGVRVLWGDGTQDDFKLNQSKDAPLVASHRYERAGQYQVKAVPQTVRGLLRCRGSEQSAMLNVQAPAALRPVAGGTAPAAQCPQGWKLQAASVNRKTGAYTCGAAPGTAPPAARPACPGELSYFENAKKGQLGCRP